MSGRIGAGNQALAREAHLLVRMKSNVVLQPIRTFADGSFLAKDYSSTKARRHDQVGLVVRVIRYTLDDPKRTGHGEVHVLITTLLVPDDPQLERLKAAFTIKMTKEEYLAYVKAGEDLAKAMYNDVIVNHPGTPWEERANYELRQGFEIQFVEAFRDPNYNQLDIKYPKP